jgi:DNA polymerase-3 subunit delta
MKIQSRDIPSFLEKPSSNIAAVLLYGPDSGLVFERAKTLGKNYIGDLNDPFSVVEITASLLKDDPAKLDDEARAISFGGTNRLIQLRNASDATAKILESYLVEPSPSSLIIVDCDELSPRSALRKLFEEHKHTGAIACYALEGRDLAKTCENILKELGVSIDQDGLQTLISALGTDHAVIRQELNKLALYVSDTNHVRAQDVLDCLADIAETSLDQLAFSVGDGNFQKADIFYRKAMAEGTSEVAILRVLQKHFQKLDWVTAQANGGKPHASIVASLRPPIFFKNKDRFIRQTTRWQTKAIHNALQILTDAEAACKSTGTPTELVCSRAIIAISNSVR